MMTRIVFCMLLLVPIQAHAATIFSEDYEVTAISDLTGRGWSFDNTNDRDGQPVLQIVTAPSGRTGKVLRMSYVGPFIDECCNAYLLRNFTGVPEFYERYYVRYDPIDTGQPSGFNAVTSKQHYFNVADSPDALTNFFFGNDEMGIGTQDSANTHPCPNGPDGPGCNLFANQSIVHFTNGVWRCVETHLGQTSADIWVDGTLTLHYEGSDWFAPANWYAIMLYRQAADNQYRYEDDYVVATTRVGCAAGGGGSTAGGGLDF